MTAGAARSLIEDMALALVVLPELGDDLACIRELVLQRFRAKDVFMYLDAARELARQARADEAELWAELNRI
jgi:hypothetical protein